MTDKLEWIEKNKHKNNRILIRTDVNCLNGIINTIRDRRLTE